MAVFAGYVLRSTPTHVNEVVMEWQGILQLLKIITSVVLAFSFSIQLSQSRSESQPIDLQNIS